VEYDGGGGVGPHDSGDGDAMRKHWEEHWGISHSEVLRWPMPYAEAHPHPACGGDGDGYLVSIKDYGLRQ
jgi:hypothetical protein